jgi:hypothetical protein
MIGAKTLSRADLQTSRTVDWHEVIDVDHYAGEAAQF